MRDFEIEQVSLNFKWTYKTLIPSLPVVGTDAFGFLCKKLSPFGLSASRIIADAPSNKLGDAQMTIILLDGRLGIKFSISSFEIISDELLEGDEQIIVDLGEIVFGALAKIDKDVMDGNGNVNLRYHLKLEPNESRKVLLEHLNLANSNPSVSPEVAIYQVNFEENSLVQSSRVAIAESLAYKDSIFFDISLDYSGFEDLNEFASNVVRDVISVLNIFELNGEIISN